MSSHTFGTVINCMDGRVQVPVIDLLKKNYNLDYIDTVTEPGPELVLAENSDNFTIQSIKRKVEISVSRHNSTLIAVAGHMDCAGNPADSRTKQEQITKAIGTVRSWKYGVRLVGLFVDEDWEVRQIETGDTDSLS
ncbi:carbonic anhydrase [Chloroflexota bacterium]